MPSYRVIARNRRIESRRIGAVLLLPVLLFGGGLSYGFFSSEDLGVTATGTSVAVQASGAAYALLRVPVQAQRPELYNGCEVTSLAMLLESAGHHVSKLTLARQVCKDQTPEQRDASGHIVYWGDPNQGFVGDVTGHGRGYGVYHGPIARLLEQHLPGRSLDLTGCPFDTVLSTVASGRPVVMWTTDTFAPTDDWERWNSPTGVVRATLNEHAVLLVGYDATTVTVLDPLSGLQKSVNRQLFLDSWVQMGRQAVTYR